MNTTKRERIVDFHAVRDGGGVEVGVLTGAGKHPNADATIAEIAVWNELGTWVKSDSRSGASDEHIPPRSFIQSTFDANKEEYKHTLRRLVKLIQLGKLTEARAEEILGMDMQADIQKTIDDLMDPPNAPTTIKQKGVNNPLVVDGHLKNAIKWAHHD